MARNRKRGQDSSRTAAPAEEEEDEVLIITILHQLLGFRTNNKLPSPIFLFTIHLYTRMT
jgi:hypothetical protein